MRRRLTNVGIPCPAWAVVTAVAELTAFGAATGWPVVVKTPRGGYDGRGVRVVGARRPRRADWLARAGPLLAEAKVAVHPRTGRPGRAQPARAGGGLPGGRDRAARRDLPRGARARRPIADDHALAAQRAALAIAAELKVVGMLAVELFDTPDGVLVNELAMRPHNSGHWTIEGAVTSQFEQHLRAVLDLPLGEVAMRAPHAVMANVLGADDPERFPDLYGGYLHCLAHDPGLHIHNYGKTVVPGRKVGHVTVTGTDPDDLLERARHAAAFLRGEIDG